MDVFLDNQAINNQHFLDRRPASWLIAHAREAGHTVVLAEVVILEMVAHYRELLAKALSDAEASTSKLAALLRRPVGFSAEGLDVNDVATEYEHSLRADLKSRGCEILPLPDVGDARRLVERDLARRRPFDERGRGMRDTLLWETVMQRVQSSGHRVALISGNTGDFADKATGLLHHDLQVDLLDRQISADTIVHFATVSEFVDKCVSPVSDQMAKLRQRLEFGEFAGFSLARWISERLTEAFDDMEVRRLFLETWTGSREVRLRTIDELLDIRIESTLPLENEKVYVEGGAVAKVTVNVLGRRGDLDLAWHHVSDTDNPDWPDESVVASGPAELSIGFSFDIGGDGETDETMLMVEAVRATGELDW